MQLEILLFLQDIANPFLDTLMNLISLVGEIIPVLILLILYWCIDKGKRSLRAFICPRYDEHYEIDIQIPSPIHALP